MWPQEVASTPVFCLLSRANLTPSFGRIAQDHNVGRVLTALNENGQEDNTIVSFWVSLSARALHLR